MKSLITIILSGAVALGFSQPLELDQALRQAVQNRPGIEAARKSVERAKLHARSLGVQAPLTLGVGASSNTAIGGSDDDLFISQGFDLFGKLKASRRLGEAGVEEARAQLRSFLLTLQTDVLSAYFEAVTAAELSNAAQDLLRVAEALLGATKRRFEEGKVPEVQITRSTIEVDRAKQGALLRRAQYQAAIKRLAGAIGQSESSIEVNLGVVIERPNSSSIADRPDLLSIKAEISAAKAEMEVARASLRPELELRASRSPWGDSAGIYGGRVQLTWPLYDHGKTRLETDAARKKAEAAEKRYQDTEGVAKAELSAIETEIESARQQVATYSEIVALARDLVMRSQLGYSEGVGTLIDVLEATQSLREVEKERAEAKLQLNKSLIQYYQTTGTLLEVLK